MSYLEDRLRRLERRLVWQPSIDEYLDASNREGVRALNALAERAALHGFDSGYLLNEYSFRMLAEDTPEKRERDREIVEAWYRAQGIVPELEGAKERLLAKLAGS